MIEKSTDVIRDNRTLYERECFMLFAPMVAAKTAAQGAVSLLKLCNSLDAMDKDGKGPITRALEVLETDGPEALMEILKASSCGKYKLMMGFFESYREVRPCLFNGKLTDYEKLKGISYKSSRFYALMNRPGIKVAALDTHILAELRENGVSDVPKSTPSNNWKKYERLQKCWLRYCHLRYPDNTPAEVDIATWVRRSGSQFKLPELFA